MVFAIILGIFIVMFSDAFKLLFALFIMGLPVILFLMLAGAKLV